MLNEMNRNMLRNISTTSYKVIEIYLLREERKNIMAFYFTIN